MQENFSMIVGRCIQSHRDEKHISPVDLARLLGTSRPTIANWESGKTVPDVRNARAMCDLLEIQPAEILGYESAETGRPSFTKEEANRIALEDNALTHRNVYFPQSDIMVPEHKKMLKDVFKKISEKYHFQYKK